MEGKVSKNTWNMIKQISISGRRSSKALKMFPILPCPEAHSSDQAANLLGEIQNCRLSALQLLRRNRLSYASLARPAEKRLHRRSAVTEREVNRPHFQVPQGFRETAARTVKWKNLLPPCNLCNQVMQSGCLWLTSTDGSSLSPIKFLLLALVLWTQITLLCLKINARQTGDARNKTFCVFSPVVEKSGSKGEGAEEFHWFKIVFLSLCHWPKKHHWTILSHNRHKLAWV